LHDARIVTKLDYIVVFNDLIFKKGVFMKKILLTLGFMSIVMVADTENSNTKATYTYVLNSNEETIIDNTKRFDNKNLGIVIDNATNLMWQNEIESKTVQKQWGEAIGYCKNLTLGGYNDWRLPNIRELFSLVDMSKEKQPFLNSVFYIANEDNKLHQYWTSSEVAIDYVDKFAYYVSFNFGLHLYDHKSNINYVKCVRDNEFLAK